jgi:hypothetical protein
VADHALAAIRVAGAGLAEDAGRLERGCKQGQNHHQRLARLHFVTAFVELRYSQTSMSYAIRPSELSLGFVDHCWVLLDGPFRILMPGGQQREVGCGQVPGAC